ncbi:Pyruvate dehydrogenase [termite gut metagenome]|uniref:Pyruvate dehydrogenase n=1 Tax=termite gut metagenome TaxID=433724 RepID=A0A5J4REW0_9ZZZZ
MLSPKYFIKTLKKNNIEFFTGVPDSLLKNICAYISDHFVTQNNIIAANEGAAIGLAAGYYMATGKIPVVYMQNSGLGNTINPLLSLTDKEVYNIPLILLVGWRGEPGIKDEPQHIKQGKVTIPLLDTIGINNIVLSKKEEIFKEQLETALDHIKKTKEPFAFVVQKDVFDDYKLKREGVDNKSLMSRESAIQVVLDSMTDTDIVVSTTGMISRELFEYRELKKQGHEKDFLTVGSMGHASQIALSIALQKSERKVFCFDGDGAALMHMGSMATIGSIKPKNYVHIVFNNGAHDSVGGQPTVGLRIKFPQVALSCGYTLAISVEDESLLKESLTEINFLEGPVFFEIKVKKGARKNLGRPTTSPVENKNNFMDFLSKA